MKVRELLALLEDADGDLDVLIEVADATYDVDREFTAPSQATAWHFYIAAQDEPRDDEDPEDG